MKNYINETTKEVFAYESDGSQDDYIQDGLVPITDADIATLRNQQEQERLDALTYVELRAEAYPSLTEQADMAYWDRQNGTTTLDDAITAVKEAHPKPTA
jgi:hypothetical protein